MTRWLMSAALLPVLLLGTLSAARADYLWEFTGGPEGAVVQSMLTTPRGTLLAGTDNGGLYRSTDGGGTWNAVDLAWPCCNYYVPSLAASADAVYLGSWGGGVYRSDDDGETWYATGAIPEEGYPIVLGLAVCKYGGTVYAGGQFGVARSDDGGASWTLMSDGLPSSWVRTLALRGTVLYARLDQDIYRYDADAETWIEWEDGLYSTFGMQSIGATADALFLAGHEGGVYHLDCGDSVWVAMNDGLWDDNVDVVIEVDQALYAGLMGGGEWRWNWSTAQWEELNTGLWNRDVRVMGKRGLSPYAGTWGGGVFQLDPETDEWSSQMNGMVAAPVTALLVDGDEVYAGTEGGGVFHSGDQGDTWTRWANGLSNIWVWALVADAGDVYAGTWGGVFKSSDQGVTWSGTALTGTGIFSMGVWESALYAGSYDGIVRSSADGGASWDEVGSGLPTASVVGLARIGDVLYAALWEQGVYALPNGETTWTAMNTGLPQLTMRSLAAHGGVLFVGTDGKGVYRWNEGAEIWDSCGPWDTTIWTLATVGTDLLAGGWGVLWATTDLGDTWTDVHGDLKPWPPVRALAAGAEHVFAGLWGGSVWRAPVDVSAVDDGGDDSGAVVAPGVLRVHPNPSGSGASVAFVLEAPQPVELAVYDAAGRLVATVVSGELPAGSHEQVWDGTTASGEKAAAGVYFVRLKAGGEEQTAKSVLVR